MKVQIWDNLGQKWGKLYSYNESPNLRQMLTKVEENICLYYKNPNLRQVQPKVGEISDPIRRVKALDRTLKKWGKYLLLFEKSKFETGSNKSGGNICSYWESPNLRQDLTKVGEVSAPIRKVQI